MQRARAEKIRQEATERIAALERQQAEANAMAAQAQDARAEADRLEAASAEQRERTAAERAEVEDVLRKADRIDPDVPNRATGDTAPRRAADEASDDVPDRDVRDGTVPEENVSSTRRDVDDSTLRDDRRAGDDVDRTVVDDERSKPDPRR